MGLFRKMPPRPSPEPSPGQSLTVDPGKMTSRPSSSAPTLHPLPPPGLSHPVQQVLSQLFAHVVKMGQMPGAAEKLPLPLRVALPSLVGISTGFLAEMTPGQCEQVADYLNDLNAILQQARNAPVISYNGRDPLYLTRGVGAPAVGPDSNGGHDGERENHARGGVATGA